MFKTIRISFAIAFLCSLVIYSSYSKNLNLSPNVSEVLSSSGFLNNSFSTQFFLREAHEINVNGNLFREAIIIDENGIPFDQYFAAGFLAPENNQLIPVVNSAISNQQPQIIESVVEEGYVPYSSYYYNDDYMYGSNFDCRYSNCSYYSNCSPTYYKPRQNNKAQHKKKKK